MKASPLRVHVFQHEPFEALAGIDPWLKKEGAIINFTRFYIDAALPALDSIDWLIVMGGPMSVNDEAVLPWLTSEREFIAEAIRRGKKVLGICLGAQLIAKALGGRISKNREKEIGWFLVSRLEGVEIDRFASCFPNAMEAFHWHGETFSIPSGAQHFLRSEACEHQAFSYGRNVLALQFHLETTAESLRELIEGDTDGLGNGPFVQTQATLFAQPARFESLNRILVRVLEKLKEN